jgi:N-acetylneuraminic acid mutarotase
MTAGGFKIDDHTASTEMLDANQWIPFIEMPQGVSSHCMVQVNSTTTIVIGGGTITEKYSRKTMIFHLGKQSWQTGPDMKTGRIEHACGMFQGHVLVMGGYNGQVLSSTEVWNPATNIWTEGPQLPSGLAYSSTASDHSGNIYLLGGFDGFKIIDTILKLSFTNDGYCWIPMGQKLKTPRMSHIAIPFPDNLC